MLALSNPRKDFTQVAFAVMQQATGEAEPEKELTGKKADSSKGGKAGGGNGGGNGAGIDLNLDPLLLALLQKIPAQGVAWPIEKRLRWFKTFAMNVSQVYDEDENPIELIIKITDD